ncbi:MAG: hypothetical protein KJZ78_03475 [Bryobacteraceae bacterium]|nr:hypothetical protein [Bryobacteraceae bacterium]
MKIDEAMRFPHPVLWTRTTDYLKGEFSIVLTKIEEEISSGRVKAVCAVTVAEQRLAGFLEAGAAVVGVFVTCLETYYNELIRIEANGGGIDIPPGLLRGQVIFRPIIWAATTIPDVGSTNIHPEFGRDALSLARGSILALGDVTVISVGSDKLAPMGSIFDLSLNDGVPRNQVAVQTEDEKIKILACAETLGRIQLLRNTVPGRALLLNSVYLPVVMNVLNSLRDDPTVYDGRRWYTVFSAKLDHMGIKIENADLLKLAQDLLKSPLGKVDTILEGVS